MRQASWPLQKTAEVLPWNSLWDPVNGMYLAACDQMQGTLAEHDMICAGSSLTLISWKAMLRAQHKACSGP